MPWHYAILFILGAHVLALLFPGAWQQLIAAPTRLYVLEVIGLTLALVALVALALLIIRRLFNARILRVTSVMDWALLVALLAQVTLGFWVALAYRWGSDWYLYTAVPWIESLVKLSPDITYVTSLPLVVKLHMLNGFLVIALLPFTRLVHILTFPITYLWRPYQVVIWNRRKPGPVPQLQALAGDSSSGRSKRRQSGYTTEPTYLASTSSLGSLHEKAVADIARLRFAFPDRDHLRYATYVNGGRRSMGVGTSEGFVAYPSIVVVRQPEEEAKALGEVETAETVNDAVALYKWRLYSDLAPLYLYVPPANASEALALCRRFRIPVIGIRTWNYESGSKEITISDYYNIPSGLAAMASNLAALPDKIFRRELPALDKDTHPGERAKHATI